MAFAIVAAVLALSAATATAQLAGGATSIANYMNSASPTGLIADYNSFHSPQFPSYDSVGSSQGIAGFNNGTFALGLSDDPMTQAQDAMAPAGGKLTVPVTLGTYSFITNKAAGLKISGFSLSNVYLGVGAARFWANFGEPNATIVPVCRADGSGTTELITRYFKAANNAWPTAYVGQATLLGGPFNPALVGGTGTGGVVTIVAGNNNAIGYAQSGLATGKASEIAIDNPAGQFVLAVNANPSQSIPRTLPPYNSSWAGVTLINGAGAATYPIVSFVYSFIRDTYHGSKYAGTNGALVKSFELYIQTTRAQNLASKFFFFAIPSSITTASTTAVNKVITS